MKNCRLPSLHFHWVGVRNLRSFRTMWKLLHDTSVLRREWGQVEKRERYRARSSNWWIFICLGERRGTGCHTARPCWGYTAQGRDFVASCWTIKNYRLLSTSATMSLSSTPGECASVLSMHRCFLRQNHLSALARHSSSPRHWARWRHKVPSFAIPLSRFCFRSTLGPLPLLLPARSLGVMRYAKAYFFIFQTKGKKLPKKTNSVNRLR